MIDLESILFFSSPIISMIVVAIVMYQIGRSFGSVTLWGFAFAVILAAVLFCVLGADLFDDGLTFGLLVIFVVVPSTLVGLISMLIAATKNMRN